ncbi:efflux transporter, RND family, MFP subunit [Hydrogenophaga sp. RAC07]|uniref:efflux RND transporter periplasmic adaptor subunit n=1 Tax=Hydrogenophaga sp. RAC07 TaxID=1842537 RepID=UPI00083CC5E0|nr:efflux RND transporter periplasmic adaptor subunit [Hydrogenophaga sp. RAC07]AOF84993.1 efflux transporter, RND family, MFP subunit [Hydrogenophaga sp. RAC07]
MNQVSSTAVRKRSPWQLAVIALVALAVLGGGLAWVRYGPGAKAESAYITATVQRGDIEDQVSATGSLQPRDYVDVGAQVSGQLRKILVEVGSEVKEGDLLAEIDAETSMARVEASRAQLRSQAAQMTERELALGKAERDLQRQKNLMLEEATTTETLQNAETTVRTARAQIQSLKASMEQLQASMRVEEANLKFTKIYAPMGGTVVSITARQGQTLNTNQSAPTLMRIADLSVMTVQTQVSEADVSKLRGGMPVYFTTLGGQGRRWYGELKKIEPTPTVTNNVVLYNALFEVPNNNRSLMTQMTAQVFFVVSDAKDVLMVPMSALTIQRSAAQGNRGVQGGPPAAGAAVAPGAPAASAPAAGTPGAGEPARTRPAVSSGMPRNEAAARPVRGPRQAKAKVMAEDSSIKERDVTIGVSNRVHAEVLSGLKEGERVVAGVREPERRTTAAQQGAGVGQAMGGPGGMPGGAAGGARR